MQTGASATWQPLVAAVVFVTRTKTICFVRVQLDLVLSFRKYTPIWSLTLSIAKILVAGKVSRGICAVEWIISTISV